MRTVLIIGATRGLGEALAHQYVKQGMQVYATARYSVPQSTAHNLQWISHIDITHEGAGRRISAHWESASKVDLLVICAGYFASDTLEDLDMEKQLVMYKTCAIGPTFLVHGLLHTGLLKSGSRIVLVSGESGSITLRHDRGGNYGGHASKAALNMVGKLLSIDLKPKGIAVALVHTGYLRIQDKEGNWSKKKDAATPEEAANALRAWIDTFDISKTGQFWSVRGPAGIRSAEAVLGPVDTLPTPLQLPW
ncbi:oxidoreductase [Sporormia fimetaria CBS 119925]|uniref:Oxidoreductase n=1 Tax=Sporormia fimetaria CBS 119925 TaxID=1340428 RepID=A0A6A6VCC0_9PLEO|nr:oxidoreductase [Sporormia fimetaria CBS 119925]